MEFCTQSVTNVHWYPFTLVAAMDGGSALVTNCAPQIMLFLLREGLTLVCCDTIQVVLMAKWLPANWWPNF
jgi:hypothetical protein